MAVEAEQLECWCHMAFDLPLVSHPSFPRPAAASHPAPVGRSTSLEMVDGKESLIDKPATSTFSTEVMHDPGAGPPCPRTTVEGPGAENSAHVVTGTGREVALRNLGRLASFTLTANERTAAGVFLSERITSGAFFRNQRAATGPYLRTTFSPASIA